MSASDHLGPQFFSHEELGTLSASDYKGTVAEGVPAMDAWQTQFNSHPSVTRQYNEGESPSSVVDGLRKDIRENGMQKPITVVDWGGHRSIKEGHHRAVAAHMEGMGAPAEVLTSDQFVKRLYGGR